MSRVHFKLNRSRFIMLFENATTSIVPRPVEIGSFNFNKKFWFFWNLEFWILKKKKRMKNMLGRETGKVDILDWESMMHVSFLWPNKYISF